MTWPSSDVNTTGMDAGTDTPPRAEILSWAQKFNQLRAHVSAYMQGLLTSADAAAARATLDVPSRAGLNASGTWGISVTGTSANVTGTVAVANGGTGATTEAAAFTAIKQAATDTATGVVELATTTEASTGTDTARAVTPAGIEAHMVANALGWGQTSQDVTASRASGTTYTNSTGRPIFVEVSTSNAATAQITFFRGGVKRSRASYNGTSGSVSLSMVVPNGVTYSATVVGGIEVWTETR